MANHPHTLSDVFSKPPEARTQKDAMRVVLHYQIAAEKLAEKFTQDMDPKICMQEEKIALKEVQNRNGSQKRTHPTISPEIGINAHCVKSGASSMQNQRPITLIL